MYKKRKAHNLMVFIYDRLLFSVPLEMLPFFFQMNSNACIKG